jgi:hypothetical protein
VDFVKTGSALVADQQNQEHAQNEDLENNLALETKIYVRSRKAPLLPIVSPRRGLHLRPLLKNTLYY